MTVIIFPKHQHNIANTQHYNAIPYSTVKGLSKTNTNHACILLTYSCLYIFTSGAREDCSYFTITGTGKCSRAISKKIQPVRRCNAAVWNRWHWQMKEIGPREREWGEIERNRKREMQEEVWDWRTVKKKNCKWIAEKKFLLQSSSLWWHRNRVQSFSVCTGKLPLVPSQSPIRTIADTQMHEYFHEFCITWSYSTTYTLTLSYPLIFCLLAHWYIHRLLAQCRIRCCVNTAVWSLVLLRLSEYVERNSTWK